MAKFRVASLITEVYEEEIDVENLEAAEVWFEKYGRGDELFFIEDEDGNQVIYN